MSWANLVPNGNFSEPIRSFGGGGNFGGGEGSVVLVAEGTDNPFARIEKRRGPGGAQLMSWPFSLQKAERYRYAMRYRVKGACLVFLRYQVRDERGTYRDAKGPTGANVSIILDQLHLDPKAAKGEWVAFSREYDVPALVRKGRDPGLSLQFQSYPGPDGGGAFEVDDVCVEPLGAHEAVVPDKVSLTPVSKPLTGGREKVEKIFDWKWEIRNGLFYRDGRPYFFCGWGDGPGGGQEGAEGIWLARMQGIRFLGTYEPGNLGIAETSPGQFEVSSSDHPGWISWQRESARFGMLTEPHACTGYDPRTVMGKFCKSHPEWAGVYFDLGHYLAWDTVDPTARQIVAERRKHYFGHTFPLSGTDYCELSREPGVENMNERMCRDFRTFVRAKYGDDLALVNRTWRTDFATWDDVRPLHLDADALAATAHALALRQHVRTTRREHYFDTMRFLQLDTQRRCRNEFDDIRRLVPGLPVTVDIRGHHSVTDGYMTYDPDLIAPLEDICHVHYGFQPRVYNKTPVDEQTLCGETAYTLFAHGYFARNTDRPVVQCEDIISKAGLPGSDAKAMAANDFAQLHHRPWKFRLEEKGEDGRKAGWFKRDLDDAAWGEIKVPGAWDEQEPYRGRTGVGWYRVRFRLDGRLRNDYLDGSRTFLLHGRGVAQRGEVWLNGERIGEVEGWDAAYSFDVGRYLDFGGENEIVWRVVGDNYANGLRTACHVLCRDMLNYAVPFGERQYAQMYWSYLMRGLSGVLNWNWHEDRLLPYLPDVIAPLETAAAVALEDVRHRRGRVAYLYGFLAQGGLPCVSERRHVVPLTWFGALEFSGVRPDLVSERSFVRDVTPERYPLLVVPETELVDDATYGHFQKYVASGGTAIITTNALRTTFSRYAATDVDTLPGKIVRLPADLPLPELMAVIRPYLPAPELEVSSSDTNETLVIERLLAGGTDAKVLYLNNWGGFDHAVTVTLPPEQRGWKLTPLRGSFGRIAADGRLPAAVPSHDVAACLLTRGEPEPWMTARPSEASRTAWRRILRLNEGRDTGRDKALWVCGRHLYPYLLDRFDSFGLDNVAVKNPAALTAKDLAGAKVLVMVEGSTNPFQAAFRQKGYVKMIRDWVEAGGSLFVAAHSAGTVNAYGSVLRELANPFGLNGSWCNPVCDPEHPGLGDAWQIRSDAVTAGSPLTEGVRSVQFFAHSPMSLTRGSQAQPIVRLPATARTRPNVNISVAAVEFGRGRVFVSADSMFMQPMRIELADNAALLENAVGWLVRKPVTAEMRETFRENLFITKEALR